MLEFVSIWVFDHAEQIGALELLAAVIIMVVLGAGLVAFIQTRRTEI
jgi:hypothetical protein